MVSQKVSLLERSGNPALAELQGDSMELHKILCAGAVGFGQRAVATAPEPLSALLDGSFFLVPTFFKFQAISDY